MRPSALGMAALAACLAMFPAAARADFADAVRAYEAGDYASAFAEWLPLAERGDPAAERNIGHLYRMGWSVRQDFEEAARWYRRAAEKGFARAQANLANMYLRGQGLESDHAEAVEWFRRAALQGHAVAQYNLGLMYENGLGVERSDAKAMGWYHLASQSGHRRAQDKLALLIAKSTSERGPLIEVSRVEAAADAAPAPEKDAIEIAVLAPIEPIEPAATAVPEPIEATETAAEMAEVPVMEGPRREPIEVALGDPAPEATASTAFEVAAIEPAAGDAGAAVQERDLVAPAPDAAAVDDDEMAVEEDEEARADAAPAESDTSARALSPPSEERPAAGASHPTPEPEPVAVDAGAADADGGTAEEKEEKPGSLTAFLDALKGPNRRARARAAAADPASEAIDAAVAIDVADDSGIEETTQSFEMAALDPVEVLAEPLGTDDPGVEARDRVAEEAAIDWDAPAAPIELTGEDATPSPGETVDPAVMAAPDIAPEPVAVDGADDSSLEETAEALEMASLEPVEVLAEPPGTDDPGVEARDRVAEEAAIDWDAPAAPIKLTGEDATPAPGETVDPAMLAAPDIAPEPVAVDGADDSGLEETAEAFEMASLDPGDVPTAPAASPAAAPEVAAPSSIEPTGADETEALDETVKAALVVLDLSSEPAEPVADDANAADGDAVAAIEEEASGFFTALARALKGPNRLEREGLTVTDRAGEADVAPVAIDVADNSGAKAAAEPLEMVALDEPGDPANDRVVGGAAIERDEPPPLPPAVEIAALSPVEPAAEDVTPAPGETVEAALAAPALVVEPADDGAAEADESAALEEDEAGFFSAFLGVLKGPSRREREGSAEAGRAAEPDDASLAMDTGEDSNAEEPVEVAALGSGGAAAGADVEALDDAEEDPDALALDALRGEARAGEAAGSAQEVDERDFSQRPPPALDEEAAALDTPGLADRGGAVEDPGPVAPAIDWLEPSATPALAVVAEDEAPRDFEGADTGIEWREPTGVEIAALAETETPPVEVAAGQDSTAALPVVTAMAGLGVEFDGMSDRERLGAGLAAYRGRDYAGAVTAWLPLAERGDSRAQFYVGGLYLDGTGLPASRVWAHVFWTLSAEQGQDKARELLDVLSADMLPVELAEARDLGAAWRPVQ